MSGERDWRDPKSGRTRGRDRTDLVPGKHANTDLLDGNQSGPHTRVPGRRSLTESLPPAPQLDIHATTAPESAPQASGQPAGEADHQLAVQRRAKGGRDVSPAHAKQSASAGLALATAPLPHASTIQRAFGRHDISNIKTQVGGAASEAAHEMGAHAFTQGERIAFASHPDLHTAAHEAAHVVQQRAGHAPPSGLDTPGDSLERHADVVADAVVAGQSAEALLDAGSTTEAAPADHMAAVQRKKDTSAPAQKPHDLLEQYLAPNTNRVWRAIGDHMLAFQFPEPHPRLTWVDHQAFVEKMLKQLEANMDGFKPLAKFDEILYPTNTLKTVGALLTPGDAWSPQVGMALAQALHIAIVASIKRLAIRYLQVADSRGIAGEDGLTSDLLITSMPIDRYIAVALCEKRAVTIEQLSAKDAKAAKGKSVALRPVTLTWEGARDRKLWNWVRAEPADATAEEVAAKLWVVTDKHGDTSASFNAYLLAAAPPLFGVPKRFAVQNPNMKEYAPPNALAGDDSLDSQLLDIAVSSATDDVALGGAGPAADSKEAPAEKGQVLDTLRDCKMQLDFIEGALDPWNLSARVSPASSFIQRKAAELPSLQPKELALWARAIDGQKDRLVRISGAINTLAGAAQNLGVKSPQDDAAAPLREILEILAVSAGTSHIAQPSEAKLAEAMQLQVTLSVRAVQATERNMMGALDEVHQQVGDSTPVIAPGRSATREQRGQIAEGNATRQMSHDALALQERSRALQMQMLSGQTVDQEELDDVSLRSEEVALDAKLLGTLDAVADLNKAAREAGEGDAAIIASLFSGKFRGLPSLTKHIFDEISPLRNNLNAVRKGFDEEEKSHPSPARHKQNQEDRRRQLAHAHTRFQQIATDRDLEHFFKNAVDTIKNQQFRAACVRVAAMIGISIIAGAVAGVAARAVGGMLMEAGGAATMEELSLVAKAGKEAVRIGVDTTISSAGTSAIEGTSFTDTWKENLIINLASSAVFGSFSRYAADQAKLEGRIAKTWGEVGKLGKAAMVLKEAGAISVHTLWGAAMGEVAGRIVTGKVQPPASTIRDWALQGISVAVGRHISHQMMAKSKMYQSLEESAEGKGRGLLKAAGKLQEMAQRVISGKQPKLALDLLDEHDRFLRMEIEEIDRQIARGGDHKGVLAEERQNLEIAAEASGSEGMLETKFVLAGMEELVPGALWKGSREQIDAAIDQANKGKPKPRVSHDEANKHWKITVGDRVFEIQEVVSAAKTVDADRVVLAGSDEDLRLMAKLVVPLDKATLDVVAHGTVDDFVVDVGGTDVTIDHRRLANYIKSKGLTYERVRLLACKSGKHPKGAAQHLANKLGVPVLAPSDTLYIHPDGSMTIGPHETRNTGHWEEFKPQKSEPRFQKAPEHGEHNADEGDATGPEAKPPTGGKAKSLGHEINDEYTKAGKAIGASEDLVVKMRHAGVDVERVKQLVNGGKHPGQPPERAFQNAVDETRLAKRFESVVLAPSKKASQYAKWAADADIIAKVNELLDHADAKLYGNPKNLSVVVEWIGKGSRQHIQAIDDALTRLRQGHRVDIEAEADVVDHSDHEAIQHKNVSGGEQQMGANIRAALKQLAGLGAKNEVPPPGYRRVADVKLEPRTKQYEETGVELQKELRTMKGWHDEIGKNPEADANATLHGLGPDLEIRITNAKGTFRFEGTNFDLIP